MYYMARAPNPSQLVGPRRAKQPAPITFRLTVDDDKHLRAMAKRVGRTPAQVLFRFACDVGMLPLTGTTDPRHMKEDLALDFTLTPAELRQLDRRW